MKQTSPSGSVLSEYLKQGKQGSGSSNNLSGISIDGLLKLPIKLSNETKKNQVIDMQLEKVLGTTIKGNTSMAVNPQTGDLCYPAGCFLVVYSPKENKQIQFLSSRTLRPFNCVEFSKDGQYLAAGEQAFRQPEVTIWKIEYDTEVKETQVNKVNDEGQVERLTQTQKVTKAKTYTELKHLKGHKFGIESICFSPDAKYLITLGDPNDKGLFLWDWQNERIMTRNKLSKPAICLAFSSGQDFFVTGGYQHLKYWYFNQETGEPNLVTTQSGDQIMESQAADTTRVKLKIFVGVAIYQSKVYALTSDGQIYMFDKNRKLLKYMNIKVERAFGCSVSQGKLYCACAEGTTRVFQTETLTHLLTMSKPPPLGTTNLLSGVSRIKIPQGKQSRFADVVGCLVDDVNKRVVCMYSDKMMFIWDVKKFEHISVYRTFLWHDGPIHDIKVVPNKFEVGLLKEKVQNFKKIPDSSDLTKFVTCSSDRTIRFWHFVDPTASYQKQVDLTRCVARNAYCKDMSKMIFVSEAKQQDKEGEDETEEKVEQKSAFEHFKAKPLDRAEDGQMLDPKEQSIGKANKDKINAVRCIQVSPDGRDLACGDWVGNIRIHDLTSQGLEETKLIEAHDHEVICLTYSPDLNQDISNLPQSLQDSKYWLASGSRDKLIMVFDSEHKYEAVNVLEQHSSIITSLKFSKSAQEKVNLVSCSADKSIVSKLINQKEVGECQTLQDLNSIDKSVLFTDNVKQTCKTKVFSMDMADQAQVMVTGHNNLLTLWKMPNLEKIWEKRPDEKQSDRQSSARKSGVPQSETQLKVMIDQNASVVISSSTNKKVTLYEAATGNPICRAMPGEITTAMCLSNNLKHLITTSDHGVIYVWRLPESLFKALVQLKQENKKREIIHQRIPTVIQEDEEEDVDDSLKKSLNKSTQSASLQNERSEEQKSNKEDQKTSEPTQQEEKDFDFDQESPKEQKQDNQIKSNQQMNIPANLQINYLKDNTLVKKQKGELMNVFGKIANINNLVSNIEKFIPANSPKKEAEIKIDEDKPAQVEDDDSDSKGQGLLGDLQKFKNDLTKLPRWAMSISGGDQEDQTKLVEAPQDDKNSIVAISSMPEEEQSKLDKDQIMQQQLAENKEMEQFFEEAKIDFYGNKDNKDSEQTQSVNDQKKNQLDEVEIEVKKRKQAQKYNNMFMDYDNDDETEQKDKEGFEARLQATKLKQSTDRMFIGRQSIAEKYKRSYSIAKKPEADQEVSPTKDLVQDIIDDDTDIVQSVSKTDSPFLEIGLQKDEINQKKSPKYSDKQMQAKDNRIGWNSPKSQEQSNQKRGGWGQTSKNQWENSAIVSDQSTAFGNQLPHSNLNTRPTELGFESISQGNLNTRPTEIFKQGDLNTRPTEVMPITSNKLLAKQQVHNNSQEVLDLKQKSSSIFSSDSEFTEEKKIQNLKTAQKDQSNDVVTNAITSSFAPKDSSDEKINKKDLEQKLVIQIPQLSARASSEASPKATLNQKFVDESEEIKFNEDLKQEIETINTSLAKINQIINGKKRAQEFDVKFEVAEKVERSASLWKSMCSGLQKSTSLEIEKSFSFESMSLPRGYSSDQKSMQNIRESETNFEAVSVSSYQPSQISQSQISTQTIKEETKDLLDKYSQLLLEQLTTKLNRK